MKSIRRATVVIVGLAVLLVATACLPASPSNGRATPVRKVLILGDSMTFGWFGTSPRVHESLVRPMVERGIVPLFEGYPGDTPLEPWGGGPRWVDRLASAIAVHDPDMIVIQSMLFPGATDPGRQSAYLAAFTQLLDVAQSRGAHVYLVRHPSPPAGRIEDAERNIAEGLQAQAAGGRGISTIPLDWWLARCAGATVHDGWHLAAPGQRCHALAITMAVDQLRAAIG